MPDRRGRTVVAVAAALACLGASAGCGGDEDDPEPGPEPELASPTVPVEDAQQVYNPLVAAVVDAVAEVSAPARDTDPEVVYYDAELETCVFGSSGHEFDSVFGEDVSWDDVRAAVEEAVASEGFEVTEQLDVPGGFNGFDAVAEDGARFEVRSKLGRPSTVQLDAPLTGDCDEDEVETLPPAPE